MPSWVRLKSSLACLGQVMCSLPTLRTDWTHRHCSSQAPLSDSLLDTVESQGAATWSGAGVPVVVQRVYFLPCRCQQGGGSAAPPSSDAPSLRWVTTQAWGYLELLRERRGLSGAVSWLHSPYTWVVFVRLFSCINIWDQGMTKDSIYLYMKSY